MPLPGPGQVLIEVARCGICGSDLKMTDPASPAQFSPGCTPGHEYAGEIRALGRGVESLRVGDRVTAIPVAGCGACAACRAGDPYACHNCTFLMGGFADFTLAQASLVTRLPSTLSFEDGALVEPLACGAQAARLGNVDRDSKILVLGAGPIGLGAVYWAQRAGCENIAVCASSSRHRELALAMGASHFIEQSDTLGAQVADVLNGAPDLVFECVGRPGLINQSIACVAPRGTVVSSGMCFDTEAFCAGPATMKQIRLQFSMAYRLDDFQRAIGALDAGHVEPRAMVSATIALDTLPVMLEQLRTDRAHCKVMVSSDARPPQENSL